MLAVDIRLIQKPSADIRKIPSANIRSVYTMKKHFHVSPVTLGGRLVKRYNGPHHPYFYYILE